MNPYLAAAMMLAAGLDGIEQDLDPGDPINVNMYHLSDAELNQKAGADASAHARRGHNGVRCRPSLARGHGRGPLPGLRIAQATGMVGFSYPCVRMGDPAISDQVLTGPTRDPAAVPGPTATRARAQMTSITQCKNQFVRTPYQPGRLHRPIGRSISTSKIPAASARSSRSPRSVCARRWRGIRKLGRSDEGHDRLRRRHL